MLLQTKKDQHTTFSLPVSPLITFFFFNIADVAKTESKGQFLLSFSSLHDLKFHLLLPSGNTSQLVLINCPAECLRCTCRVLAASKFLERGWFYCCLAKSSTGIKGVSDKTKVHLKSYI